MRKWITFLALADVALVAALFVAIWQRGVALSQTSTDAPRGEKNTSLTVTSGPSAGRGVGDSVEEPAPSGINWRLLTLADLHPFVANLRAVGCPEPTIRDIILAEVNRRFAPRERALKLKYEDYALWDSPSRSRRNTLETQIQLAALFNEKKSLLKDLLGTDVDLPMPKALVTQSSAQLELALAGLPEEKRDRVKAIQENFLSEIQKFRAMTLEYMEPADIQALAKVKAEWRRSLAQALTPDELLDFDMKTSNLASTLRGALGSDVTEEEYREVFRGIRAKYDEAGRMLESGGQNSALADLGRLQREVRNGEAFKEILGAERVTELQKARDPIYLALRQTAADGGVAVEMVDQIYAVQKAAQQELMQQMATQPMTPELRRQLSQQYSEKVATAIQGLVGDENYKRFLEAGRPGTVSRSIPPAIQPRP